MLTSTISAIFEYVKLSFLFSGVITCVNTSVVSMDFPGSNAVLRAFVFTIVFSLLVRVPGPDGVPYALLVLSGLTPWLFFASALS